MVIKEQLARAQEEGRIPQALAGKVMPAEDAALLVKDGMTLATSGFTPAGYPKALPLALAARAEAGDQIGITLITGASVGWEVDTALTKAGVIKRRFPYQTDSAIRNAINRGEIHYADMHLSHLPPFIKYGYMGNIDLAVVEAVAVEENGNIYPSSSAGISNVAVATADKVIIEVNLAQSLKLKGMHDIYNVEKPPHTEPIPITKPGQRIGQPFISCPPEKIAAIIISDSRDSTNPVTDPDEISKQISKNLIGFLKDEIAAGRLPENLLPLQSGVGPAANAVLSGLADSGLKNLNFYSEVAQDSVLDLIDAGVLDSASATSLTLSPERLPKFYENFERYGDKIILRPQEISNNPEVIRRLGIISMNTAIEADIYGNVNSTHINGSRLMNGIGGSGDFTRNASISIFTTASTAKGGNISSIVPQVCHVDHSEHDVQVIITEIGVADLRAKSPIERAETIIENCVHPVFKPMLRDYLTRALDKSKHLHIPLL